MSSPADKTRTTTAAVTISEEERRRLAAFRDILSGQDGKSSTATAETAQQQQSGSTNAGASTSNNNNNNNNNSNNNKPGGKKAFEFSDDDEDTDEALERQARAAWAQSTPDKKMDKDEIWQDERKTGAAVNGGDGTSPEGNKAAIKPINAAVFSGTGASWQSGGAVNVVSPVRKAKAPAEEGTPEGKQVHVVARKVNKAGASPQQPPEGKHLSVQAVPFVPKHSQVAGATLPETPSKGGAAAAAASGTGAGSRRAPPSGAGAGAAGASSFQSRFSSNAQSGDKPLDFMRWVGGAYRGPLQDPTQNVNSNFPLWMHLAVLPVQCGLPSGKRVMRAWAVQFGLESVEYWTWRNMVSKGIRVPVDCTEPDVLSHQPVAEYLKGVLKWYDRLSNYRDIKILTDDEKSLIEKLATKSRQEFLKYLKAYTTSAKAAFELMERELQALEAESEKQRALNSAAGAGVKLGTNVTSAVKK